MAKKDPFHSREMRLLLELFGAWGVGLAVTALPPYTVFFPIGIVICYAVFFIKIWLYRAPIVISCQAKKIRGIDRTEFIIFIVMAFIELLVPSGLVAQRFLSSPQSETNTTEKYGARMEIEAAPIEKLKDGTYYLPIYITNVGDELPSAAVYGFVQKVVDRRMTTEDESIFMKVAEDDIKTKTSTKEQRIAFENNGGSYFEQNKKLMVGQPDGIFTWEQIEEIKSGQKLPYYGAVLAYTDDVSKAKKVFYYVEACFYYDGIRGNIMQCATHNFPRHDHL